MTVTRVSEQSGEPRGAPASGAPAGDPGKWRAIVGGATKAYRATALLLLNIVIAFVGLELLSFGLTSLHGALVNREAASPDARAESPYYASQPWAAQYWQEFSASRRQAYHPYVLWRRRAFAGETIHVDAAGCG